METKNWPVLPRANVSVWGAIQTTERNMTNGLSGPAKATSAEPYLRDVAVCCEVALYSTMYAPASAPMRIPTPQVAHISKELSCRPASQNPQLQARFIHVLNIDEMSSLMLPHQQLLPLSNRQCTVHHSSLRMSVQDSKVLKTFFSLPSLKYLRRFLYFHIALTKCDCIKNIPFHSFSTLFSTLP